MGFRFRKSVKIAPGVKLNFSKKGASVTVGNKYARTTIGKDRKSVSASIPGTGISYIKQTSTKSKTSPTNANTNSFSSQGGNDGPKQQMEWSTALKIIKWAFYTLLGFILLIMTNDSPAVLIGVALIIGGMILTKLTKQGRTNFKRTWVVYTFGWILALGFWVSALPEPTVETTSEEIVTPINKLTTTNNSEPVNAVIEDATEPEETPEETQENLETVNTANAVVPEQSEPKEAVASVEEAAPVDVVTPVKEAAPAISEPRPEAEYFKNCTHLRTKYPNGVASDHPAYQFKMDRDKDGWACER